MKLTFTVDVIVPGGVVDSGEVFAALLYGDHSRLPIGTGLSNPHLSMEATAPPNLNAKGMRSLPGGAWVKTRGRWP